ncbi:FAD/NAD(P)-binding domain containing protein [Rhypophila decipiens]
MSNVPEPFDIIIIGGGPAGLSAASSIVRQGHKTALFDSGDYRNSTSPHLHTVPALDYADPEKFRAKARADLDQYGSVTIFNEAITSLKQLNNGLFEAVAAENDKSYIAKKIILATGVDDIFPDIEGYEECWVSGIFHCLYCNGWEEKGVPSAGMLAQGDVSNALVALHFARQALQLTNSVTIYTNGNHQLADDLQAALKAAPAPMVVDSRRIVRLSKEPVRARITLYFDDETRKTEGFLAHKTSTKLRSSDLATQLGLELTPMGTIAVHPPFNQTSVKGVFAAGDCASPMQTITAAMHSGSCVGGGAPLQIQAELYGQKAIF